MKEPLTIIENGKALSSVLPSEIKNFLIDNDGTICDDVPNEEPERMVTAVPFPDALGIGNKWYDEGHLNTFFTSRTENLSEITETWLQQNGFKYHYVLKNKPRGGNYHCIDNHLVKATRYNGKFTDPIRTQAESEVFDDQ